MLARIFDTVCFLFVITLKAAVLNLACVFCLKGSSSTGQPSAVDSSLSFSHGACAAPEEPVSPIFHDEEEEGVKQDFCQGRNQDQTKEK